MTNQLVPLLRVHDNRTIPAPGVYQIDRAHTSIEFVARHLMITKVRGRFGDVRGLITIGVDPQQSRAEVDIGSASVSTGNDERDTHLRSADFFDVERFPTIRFISTAVTALRDGTWQINGELTVRTPHDR